jgi:hypothetical protein
MSVELASRFVRVDVRYWRQADMPQQQRHVRYWGMNGPILDAARGPSLIQVEHLRNPSPCGGGRLRQYTGMMKRDGYRYAPSYGLSVHDSPKQKRRHHCLRFALLNPLELYPNRPAACASRV